MYKYSQSPPTLHHPATVESIFERSFCIVPSSFALSFSPSPSLFLTHIHTLSLTHTHTYTHARAHKQKSSKSRVSSQHSTSLLATIPSTIVNRLRPLPSNFYRDHGSYDPTSIARHNQCPLECSQTTYRYQSNNKGEGEEDT